jgi:hypothetical protein
MRSDFLDTGSDIDLYRRLAGEAKSCVILRTLVFNFLIGSWSPTFAAQTG